MDYTYVVFNDNWFPFITSVDVDVDCSQIHTILNPTFLRLTIILSTGTCKIQSVLSFVKINIDKLLTKCIK